MVPLANGLALVDRSQARAREEVDLTLVIAERARETMDDGLLGARARLFVIGGCDACDVARDLDQGVLEPAARANERDAAFAPVADRGKGALHTGVWAAPDAPDHIPRGSA
jgi:hypothetical protein